MAESSFELRPPQHAPDEHAVRDETAAEGPAEGAQEFSLPPADGGKDALMFLLAAFVLEAVIWGE